MSSTRTLPSPRSTASRSAAQLKASRVCCFLRSRRPGPAARDVSMTRTVTQTCVLRNISWHAFILGERAGAWPRVLSGPGQWLVWLAGGAGGIHGRRCAPLDGIQAVVEGLPGGAEAGTGGQVTADGAGRAGLVAQRVERGPAGLGDHRIGCLDGEPFAGHVDDHLAAAGLFGRLVAGAGDVRAAERLLGPV